MVSITDPKVLEWLAGEYKADLEKTFDWEKFLFLLKEMPDRAENAIKSSLSNYQKKASTHFDDVVEVDLTKSPEKEIFKFLENHFLYEV